MADTERDFKGVWIPKDVWLDRRLNMLEKGILTEIDSLDNEETGCFASNKYLAEFCQCSETKVSTAISKLIKLNYVYIKSFDGRTRILKSRLSKFERQDYKDCKADTQNLQESNINNNTYNIKKERKNGKPNYDDIISENVEDEEVKQALYEFIKMRTLIKKPLTDRALKMIINKLKTLSSGDNGVAVEILNQSILNNWQDIYELKEPKDTYKKPEKRITGVNDYMKHDYSDEKLRSALVDFDKWEDEIC